MKVRVDNTIEDVKRIAQQCIKLCEMYPKDQKLQFIKHQLTMQISLCTSSWEYNQQFIEKLKKK